MKGLRRAAMVAAVTAALLGLAGVAPSAGTTSVNWVITADTTLTADFHGSIVIGADNVTLDCAGFRIVAPGELVNGVTVAGQTGVTVKNCTVDGFNGGFDIRAAGNRFINNRVLNAVEGFGLGNGADGNTLSGNRVTANNHGFWLIDASDNLLVGNTVSGTHSGFQINAGASGNRLVSNTSRDNLGYGFMLFHSTSTTLVANTASNNGWVGIILQPSSHNTLVGNTASGNVNTGIFLDNGSDQNTLSGNTTRGNGLNGIWLNGASDNLLTNNTVADNGTYSEPLANATSGVVIGSSTSGDANDNVLLGNIANHNQGHGFLMVGWGSVISGTVLEANTAANNGWGGFGAWNAQNNQWTSNTANNNGHLGFALYKPCTGNTFTNNTARNNGAFDAYDDDADPSLNTWINNNFGTAIGP